MPIYVYKCLACLNIFERLQKIDAPEPKCQCGSGVVKVPAPAGFQLKGTGWYATDFKDKPHDVAE